MYGEGYVEAGNSQKLAKQIFGIKVPFVLDNKEELVYTSSPASVNTTWAEYNWLTDVEKIFSKKIYTFCRKHSVDFESMICFCLCHETGHAKEQRLFEESGFFPIALPIEVYAKIESTNYVFTRSELLRMFMGGIFDFSVNKELLKNNLKNPFARKAYLDKETLRTSEFTTKKEGYSSDLRYRYLILNLPLVLDLYEHGGLNESERRTLKENQEKEIGDKWEKTLLKLKSIEFFDAKSKRDIMLELFENTLGIQHAYLVSNVNRKNLLPTGYSELPKFWNKDSYCVMHLS